MEEKKKYAGNPSYYKGLDKDTKAARSRDIERKSKMSTKDPKAYEPMPGDEKEPKKQSVYSAKFKKMFGSVDEEADDISYEEYLDRMDSLLESSSGRRNIGLYSLLEESVDVDSERERIIQEGADADKALRNKAKLANAPLGALRTIYDKGLAAYRTGHRPGVPQHAWAMARVNSVLTGGPARRVDAAQWKQIQDYRKTHKKKKKKSKK
jgi:hypothetical protein